ncbi:hypothetical protein MPSEU_000688100 [Mayamaea pseudoterrestris]|nr:hypothetical protein MPSEU_000688100 [Mayamaea pseudoterrestris]
MPPSRRTGRLCPWCWPMSWRVRSKPCHPRGPFLCLIQPKFRKCLRKFCQCAVLVFLVIILILWMGMAYEQAQVRKLPSTEYLYAVPQVCAVTYNDSFVESHTFANVSLVKQVMKVEQAHESHHTNSRNITNTTTTFIAHCGSCGACSTPHDVAIYDATRNTLFEESILCAKRGLVGGHRAASHCMMQHVGMTHDCNDCWVENILCDLRLCIFSCFFHAIFSKGVHDDASSSQTLNRCTQCDESRCGPAFLECAGANRRRTAIQSDIERNIKVEVCRDVQPNWWRNERLQEIWQREYGDNVTIRERRRRRKRGQTRIGAKREAAFNATRI